ncbi:MAG: GNAT family N-acetyltransferase [Oscillospiraceae bacterium]
MVELKNALAEEFGFWQTLDRHLLAQEFENKVREERVQFIVLHGEAVGVLRWGLFWDEYPFLNLLYLTEEHRNAGIGSAVLALWEARLRELGFALAMTSTMAEERVQGFFHLHGYQDCGCLIKTVALLIENAELFLMKGL